MENICTPPKVTIEVIIKETNDDASKEYLQPRQIKNHEHIVQVTRGKFEDLKGRSSNDQTRAFQIILAQGN